MDKVEIIRKIRLGRPAQWRWRYVAPNGRALADSGESYNNQGDCIAAMRRVIGIAEDELSWDVINIDERLYSAHRVNRAPIMIQVLR